MTTFDHIAAFTLSNTKVPESALDMAATLLIDTVGVAAGASVLQAGQIARDHAVRFHAAGTAGDASPLMFDGRTVSIPGAAFAAATQIDNLDAHDGYNPTKGHIGCAVVPALFAFAAARPDLSGPDALRALVIAYEVAARAGIALHASVTDYHTSGAWNALAVAALGCRLRQTGAEHLRHALGIAEYHGPRSQMMREIANPTMLHDGSGMGALVGAMAALMAMDGFTGAPALTIEDADRHWTDLGQVWTVEQNYVKPYPICRWAHAALDALGALMQAHGFSAETVAGVEVQTFEEAAALFPDTPQTSSQAQYSLRFALAALLLNGHVGPEEITEPGLSDAKVAALLPLISVTPVSRHSDRFPNERWSDVVVKLSDGTRLKSGDVHARGGPEAPMSLEEVEAKFHRIARPLPRSRRTAIWEMRSKLAQGSTRFADLASLVHPPIECANA